MHQKGLYQGRRSLKTDGWAELDRLEKQLNKPEDIKVFSKKQRAIKGLHQIRVQGTIKRGD